MTNQICLSFRFFDLFRDWVNWISYFFAVIPSTANLFITALSDQEDWKTSVGFWNDAYGLKFECLRRHTLRFPSVHAVDAACVVAETVTLRSFDLMTCRVGDLDFSTETVFTPTKSCNLTALVGFFDVGYNLDENNHKVREIMLLGELIVGLTHPFTHSFISDWVSDCLFDWSIHWLIDWLRVYWMSWSLALDTLFFDKLFLYLLFQKQ